MREFLVICVQAALFTITWCVMSQYLPRVTTPPTDHPWYHSSRDKALRQGPNHEESNQHVEKTELPPKRDCVCSKIYDPVCASNNESYFNLCFLECKVAKTDNISVVHQGNCIPF